MADETKSESYFGSDEGRLATTQDEQRLRGESAPPAQIDESGTPRFAKGHAPVKPPAPAHHASEEERRRHEGSANT